MLVSEIAIVNLGFEHDKPSGNAENYLDLVKKDQKLIYKVQNFLQDLSSNKDLQTELYELKKLRYQKAHLLAQKQLAKTFISLKTVQNLLKKVQPAKKDSIPLESTLECAKSYCQMDIDYSETINSIPSEVDNTPEVQKTNEKLRQTVEELKNIHAATHKKVREVLVYNGVKLVESFDLPVKKKAAEITLGREEAQKLKTLLDRLVEFSSIETKLGAQLGLEISQVDVISQTYLNKIFKSLDYHFLAQTELNAVDKPEWMVNFIEEALCSNIAFLLSLGFEKRIINAMVVSFLGSFYTKLQQRFQQDSNFFLEHEFLFTNFLCCLNEHSYRVMKFLEEKGIPLENKDLYDLTQIYKGKTEYLERLISGELKEFQELIFDKIDQMEIVTKDVPNKQKFDIALAETLENFVLLYAKNLKKYNATSTDFISQFVRENMLDKAVRSLTITFKNTIQDTEGAALGPRFYIMDSIISVSEYTLSQLKGLEEFQKAGADPGYDEAFESVKNYIVESVMTHLEDFWKRETKTLRGFLKARPVLNAFSSQENINESELLEKDPVPEVKNDMADYISTIATKLQEPLATRLLTDLLEMMNQFILEKIIKEYKFSVIGLRFVKSFTLLLCEELKNVRPQLYASEEKKLDDIIKYLKCDKNIQFQLVQKINSIEESTIPEETKILRKQTALQNYGYSNLNPKEVLILYDAQLLV